MWRGFKIGRIRGVDIAVDWSLFIVLWLIGFSLSASLFPAWHPNWPTWAHWTLGFTAAILFFASVLVHELARAMVAKRYGLPVRRITLFLFGGITGLEEEPRSANTELAVALVGPLTSIVIGVIASLLASAAAGRAAYQADTTEGVLMALGPGATLLAWLGPINILLGLFNLLPGFPLDGGRVLRAIVWRITGDFRRATRVAAGCGRVLSWLLMACGALMLFGVRVPLLGRGFVGGLWLLFIGWFLNRTALYSYQRMVVIDLLDGVPVARLMRRETPVVSPDMTVSQVVDDYLLGTEEHAFPVVQDGRVVGMITLDDVRKVPRSEWPNKRVEQVMTPVGALGMVKPNEPMTEAFEQLERRNVQSLPVVEEDGRLSGVLRYRDILKWIELQSGAVPA